MKTSAEKGEKECNIYSTLSQQHERQEDGLRGVGAAQQLLLQLSVSIHRNTRVAKPTAAKRDAYTHVPHEHHDNICLTSFFLSEHVSQHQETHGVRINQTRSILDSL